MKWTELKSTELNTALYGPCNATEPAFQFSSVLSLIVHSWDATEFNSTEISVQFSSVQCVRFVRLKAAVACKIKRSVETFHFNVTTWRCKLITDRVKVPFVYLGTESLCTISFQCCHFHTTSRLLLLHALLLLLLLLLEGFVSVRSPLHSAPPRWAAGQLHWRVFVLVPSPNCTVVVVVVVVVVPVVVVRSADG